MITLVHVERIGATMVAGDEKLTHTFAFVAIA